MEKEKLLKILETPNLHVTVHDQICNKLCMIYYNSGEKTKALEFLSKRKNMNHTDYLNMANILYEIQNYTEACKYYEQILKIDYNIDIAYKLACIYNLIGDPFNSYRTYKNILTLDPDNIRSLNNIAEIQMAMLKQEEAIENYKKAFELEPKIAICSNIIMNSLYVKNSETLQYKNFSGNFLEKNIVMSTFSGKPRNKIKIGYISQEFLNTDKTKPVNCFINHILENHSDKFQTYTYFVHRNKLTEKEETPLYTDIIPNVISRNLTGKSIQEIINDIREDNLDILVELMNHTSGNVLEILHYKPARFQISYCAFPETTGLKSIDYKILDSVSITEENTKSFTEKILKMPNGFHCYQPTYEFPKSISISEYEKEIQNRSYYLCSFANPKKLNSDVIRIWSQILKENVKMVLRHSAYTSSYIRQCIMNEFQKHGITENQIKFIGSYQNYSDALKIYNMVDLFLDTFPYNGTTTICEALKMNVPVITLKGDKVESRMGASLLISCNLKEFICETEEEYINKIRSMLDIKILVSNRQKIKDTIKDSYLMDSKMFMKDYENLMISVSNNK